MNPPIFDGCSGMILMLPFNGKNIQNGIAHSRERNMHTCFQMHTHTPQDIHSGYQFANLKADSCSIFKRRRRKRRIRKKGEGER